MSIREALALAGYLFICAGAAPSALMMWGRIDMLGGVPTWYMVMCQTFIVCGVVCAYLENRLTR